MTLRQLFAFVSAIACIVAWNSFPTVVGDGATHPIAGFGIWNQEYVQTGWPLCIYQRSRQAALEETTSTVGAMRVYRTRYYSRSLDPYAIVVNSVIAIVFSWVLFGVVHYLRKQWRRLVAKKWSEVLRNASTVWRRWLRWLRWRREGVMSLERKVATAAKR